MKAGAIVAGRWRLVRELPGTRDAWRWACEDERGGPPAECVGLRASALLWSGAREGFDGVPDIAHPAVLPILARDTVDGVPVRIRPATRGPLPRLSREEGIQLLGWLAGAVMAGNGAARGCLRDEDVVVDDEGTVRFAPLGAAPPRAVQANPHRAPELDAGSPATATADLYGLGVIVQTAVTGSLPWPATTTAELVQRRAHPRPRVGNETLDTLLDGTLTSEPSARVVPMFTGSPVRIDAARMDAAPRAGAATTALASRQELDTARPSAPFPRYIVMADTQGLGPAALVRLAARSSSDVEAVRQCAREGRPWVVDGFSVEEDARRLTRTLATLGLPSRIEVSRPPRVVQFIGLSILALAGGIALDMWIVGALLAGVCAWIAMTNFRTMFTTARVRMAWNERGRNPAAADSITARLGHLRERIGAANLPDAAAAHLVSRADALARAFEDADTEGIELAVAGAATTTTDARKAELVAEFGAIEADLARLATELRTF